MLICCTVLVHEFIQEGMAVYEPYIEALVVALSLTFSGPVPMADRLPEFQRHGSYGECVQSLSGVRAAVSWHYTKHAQQLGGTAEITSLRIICRRVRDNRLEDILPRQ